MAGSEVVATEVVSVRVRTSVKSATEEPSVVVPVTEPSLVQVPVLPNTAVLPVITPVALLVKAAMPPHPWMTVVVTSRRLATTLRSVDARVTVEWLPSEPAMAPDARPVLATVPLTKPWASSVPAAVPALVISAAAPELVEDAVELSVFDAPPAVKSSTESVLVFEPNERAVTLPVPKTSALPTLAPALMSTVEPPRPAAVMLPAIEVPPAPRMVALGLTVTRALPPTSVCVWAMVCLVSEGNPASVALRAITRFPKKLVVPAIPPKVVPEVLPTDE